MVDALRHPLDVSRSVYGSFPMRNLFLIKDPEIDSVDMQTLVGVANAIEHEALRRYALLIDRMEQQGEATTAAAFQVMLDEERKHVEAVGRWAERLGQRVPAPEDYAWQLPEELSSSWTDISGSALLTPYRAFAIAVENEQRAFSFYTYLAARAEDPQVMAEAEKLAVEELQHAALLRRFRRRAWHRERRPARAVDISITSARALRQLIAAHEAAIARSHRDLGSRLRRIGDEQSARLLEELSPVSPRSGAPEVVPDRERQDRARDAEPLDGDAAHLLVQAQKPLEAFSETLEAVMRTTEGELFAQAEVAMVDVVTRLARISLQTAQRLQEKTRSAAPTKPFA